jgi:hypothetical protein
MHARQCGLDGVEESFIDACLHARSYDPQCEGGRAEWLFDILTGPRVSGELARTLVDRLGEPSPDHWDTTQRTYLARELARRGFDAARSYLYSCLRREEDSADVTGVEDIIALDGADGLIHVATRLGEMLRDDPSFWSDDRALKHFDETRGEGAARRILDAAAAHSGPIAVYLRHIDAREPPEQEANRAYVDLADVRFKPGAANKHVDRMRSISAEAVIHDIETEDPGVNLYWFWGWSRNADDESLGRVFEAMLHQAHPGRLVKYLRVFSRRPLAAFDPRMLPFADHPDLEVRRLAHVALSNYAHAEVRSLALRKIAMGQSSEKIIPLLAKNYRTGDAHLIERVLMTPPDREELHSLVSDLAEVIRANPVSELSRTMLFVYEESPCSLCRHEAVKALRHCASAPSWLLEEGRHDASDEIRELTAKPN